LLCRRADRVCALLGKFLLRHGRRPEGLKAWTQKYLEWIKTHVRFDQPALEATPADSLEEVDHLAARILRLEKAIDDGGRESAGREGLRYIKKSQADLDYSNQTRYKQLSKSLIESPSNRPFIHVGRAVPRTQMLYKSTAEVLV
jgi:hypothetical protein